MIIEGKEVPFKIDESWLRAMMIEINFSLTERSIILLKNKRKISPFLQISHYAVHLAITYSDKNIDKYSDQKRKKHATPEFAAMTEDMDEGIGLLLDKVIFGN